MRKIIKFKIKNRFFDLKIRQAYWKCLGKIELLLALFFVFTGLEFENNAKGIILFIVMIFGLYVAIWIKSNFINKINIMINGIKIEIRYGNIFKETGKKVITFNEYFDTIVDDEIINEESINGQFIKQYSGVPKEELDKIIEKELKNKDFIFNGERKKGKKKRYKIGTTIKYNAEYLLTAFTRFNERNNTQITVNEYLMFLIDLWKEIECLYAQKKIVVPLIGNGTTKIVDRNICKQEILELLLITLKISNIKIASPSKLIIILDEEVKDNINLYKIKEEYKYE